MEIMPGEKYLISKAKQTQVTDPHASKAWIITAKTLYPNDFGVQFEAYQLEKNSEKDNYEEAAKCFSYIVMTFQAHPAETTEALWNEISQLTSALRIPEGSTTPEQEFYVRMFQHIPYDVQHKILLLTANHSDNNLEHCRLILILLKRFPQAIPTHAPRLLETIIQGMMNNPRQFREMLVVEALPLIIARPPEIGNQIVNRLMGICFEYYVNIMFEETEDRKTLVQETWRKIFEILELCGKMLKWEPFLPYNKNWNKNVYWKKLVQIVSSTPPRPSENKQILFCATILFVFSLQDYINSIKYKVNYSEVSLILVEGFKNSQIDSNKRKKLDASVIEGPDISPNYPCTDDTSICFVIAAHCWELLHSNEILQMDFNQIILTLPINSWINKFLLDFSLYFGRNDESTTLLKETTTEVNSLERNVRLLSLTINQGTFTVKTFELIALIIGELPQIAGRLIQNLYMSTTLRHLVLLPMAKRPILQYVVKLIINSLKPKILNANCDNIILGNLLVLLQLDWPLEITLAESIFEIIRQRQSFTYLLFSKYIIVVDIIEEFMNMWYPHGGSVQLEFSAPQPTVGQRRIGTRGADKGVKEDFKHVIKQQICRSNEDIDLITVQFLTQESSVLIQNIFDK